MENDELLIEEPYNPCDLVVKFDPKIEKPSIAKSYVSEEDNKNMVYESVKTDGFDVPIVFLNNQVLQDQFINSLKINYYDFLPTLEIIVDDPRNDIQVIGSPGLKNFVSVILCPQSDGVYRSIAMPFYIKDRINLATDKIKYVCEYYNLGLTDVNAMQIGDGKLTTYEFCEKVAKLLNIGFACTDNCENISDKRYRQSYSQRFKDFIKEQISIGGLDKDSIFDAWIDTHGYLSLVNISWIFDKEVKAENLTIVVNPKIEIPTKNNSDDKEPFEVQRTLLEFEHYPFSNLRITKKYNQLDTNITTKEGTDASFWYLTSVNNENLLVQQDIQMDENSIEGKDNETYKFRKLVFLGCEMSDEPYMIQEQIRKRWLEKKRAKQLTVELARPNYGLERGTLVNVGIMETEPGKMRMIYQNFKNTKEETKKEDENYNVDNDAEPINISDVTDGNTAMVNPALSGMYYIDGMKYVYTKDYGKVIQVLYLIKKGEDNNLFHSKSSTNITEEQKDIMDAL